MALPRFQVVRSGAPTLDRAQDSVARALDPLSNHPLLDGVLLRGVALAAGSNPVAHGLGRAPVGWWPTRRSSAATLYDTQSTNATPMATLALTASASITVDLWVF